MIINQTEETNVNEEWKSCCLKVDKNALKYFVQVGILGGLIIFSSTMLVVEKGCDSQRNYASLLMVCLGVFLPQPKISK
jgi:hypothetical protein